jgi:hypothetical protein
MAKIRYPQINLEDYQLFQKFMLPGEFPATHAQWVETIEKQKRKDASMTHEGAVDVPVQLEPFKKHCADTNSPRTCSTLDQYVNSLPSEAS